MNHFDLTTLTPSTLLTLFAESVKRMATAAESIEAVLRGEDNNTDNLHAAAIDFSTEMHWQDKLEALYYSATGGELIRHDAAVWR